VALIAGLIAPVGFAQQVDMAVYWHRAGHGAAAGPALRRWVWKNLFTSGPRLLGTALCMFAAGALAQWAGRPLATAVEPELALVALADGLGRRLHGMMAAICVAFRPHWLATWSDRLYLRPPGAP
jgi:hypothetical protein